MITIGLSTLYLAKILSLYLLIVGVAMLFNKNYYQSILTTLVKNEPLLLVTGFIALILGLLMVVFHNIWVWDWPVFVTVIGWLALLKGILRLMFPRRFLNAQIHFIQSNIYYNTSFIVLIVLGIFLACMAFIIPQPLTIEWRV